MRKEEILNSLDIKSFYDTELSSLKTNSTGWAQALCPFHEDTKPSFSVNLHTGRFRCFGCDNRGSVFDFYMERNSVDFPEAKRALAELAGVSTKPERREMETYDYTDETGDLIFQTVRYKPKDFRQRRPDGNSGWAYNLTGVRKVPYNLSDVLKSETVIIVEGEKDADNLGRLGFTATCCPMGAGKWKPEYNEHFRDRDVMIIPDNDEPGMKHSREVANSLKGFARTIKILDLEGIAEKEDITDWIERRYEEGKDDSEVRDELLSLIEDTSEWEAEERKIIVPTLSFPSEVMTGIAGDFATLYSQYLESPPEFFFFSFLTCLGSYLSDRLTTNLEIHPQPRLFTILVGESADDRKSTAATKTIEFFKDTLIEGFEVCYGVGSAEGLQERLLKASPSKLLLFFDEFKSFVDKCSIKGSTLLPCVNTLFELNRYESQTKHSSVKLDNSYLSILAATTKATFDSMWSSTFTNIGFNNRLFLVSGTGKRKYAMPQQIPEAQKKGIKQSLLEIISQITPSLSMEITRPARDTFEEWYLNLDQSIHTKRIDTMALRLLPLLAVNEKKTHIDRDVIEKTVVISNWQLEVRKELDPIDADTAVAKMEQKIRRLLVNRGPMSVRDLRRYSNADKTGMWVFKNALKNLEDQNLVFCDRQTGEYTFLP